MENLNTLKTTINTHFSKNVSNILRILCARLRLQLRSYFDEIRGFENSMLLLLYSQIRKHSSGYSSLISNEKIDSRFSSGWNKNLQSKISYKIWCKNRKRRSTDEYSIGSFDRGFSTTFLRWMSTSTYEAIVFWFWII